MAPVKTNTPTTVEPVMYAEYLRNVLKRDRVRLGGGGGGDPELPVVSSALAVVVENAFRRCAVGSVSRGTCLFAKRVGRDKLCRHCCLGRATMAVRVAARLSEGASIAASVEDVVEGDVERVQDDVGVSWRGDRVREDDDLYLSLTRCPVSAMWRTLVRAAPTSSKGRGARNNAAEEPAFGYKQHTRKRSRS